MAHHKRPRATTRKEGKRLDNKRARAAEAQALNGARPKTVHTDYHWGVHPGQPPLLDLPSRPQSVKKKRRPKKERCPINGKHECLTDEEQITEWGVISYWPNYKHGYTTTTRIYKLCVHCGKEWERINYRVKPRYRRFGHGKKWRPVK